MNGPELNLALAETQFPNDGWEIYKDDPEYPELLWVKYEDGEHYRQINYLENWNDLMPLVKKYGISSLHQNCDNSWMTDQFHGDAIVAGDNLQRAYCECLLKVLIEGKVK